MNKKGFTLIELIVSILLVSIVLISMTGTLLSLKDTYTQLNENVEAKTYSSLIAKVINDHFIRNNGIKNVTCNEEGIHCDIILGNNKEMTLDIIDVETKVNNLTDASGNRIISTDEVTTLKYAGENYSYYKTLKYTKRDYGANNIIESGYKFSKLEYKELSRENNVADSTLKDVLSEIIIHTSDPKYNIELYSSSTLNNSSVASRYTLTLNSSVGIIPQTNNFTVINNNHIATKRYSSGNNIGTLPTPTREDYIFDGWLTEIQGNEKATSGSIINSDMTLYARWKTGSGENCHYETDPEDNNNFIYVCTES